MDEFLGKLGLALASMFGRGGSSSEPKEGKKGSRENPVELPPIQANPPGQPGLPPLLMEALNSPFAVDTLQRVLGVNPTVTAQSGLNPAIDALTYTDSPDTIIFNRAASSRLNKDETERTLGHEMAHSAHLQDKMGLLPLSMLTAFNRSVGQDTETYLRPVKGFSDPLSRRPDRSMPNNFEHLAYIFEAAMDAVRNKSTADPRIWSGIVDEMDRTSPGVKAMTNFILDRLGDSAGPGTYRQGRK